MSNSIACFFCSLILNAYLCSVLIMQKSKNELLYVLILKNKPYEKNFYACILSILFLPRLNG